MKLFEEKLLSEVKMDFNIKFPGLQLKFYKKPHREFEGNPKGQEYTEEYYLLDISPGLIEGEINLDENKTVGEFESEMENRFGLHIQVFRRSNQIWLQTVNTDDWTLKFQNEKGIESTKRTIITE